MQDRLRSFVPPVVARRLDSEVSTAWGERLRAAILFADISGFTPLAERLSNEGKDGTERLSGLLDGFFFELFEIIHHWGGQVLKIAGDAPIAVWPETEEGLAESVARAAACALELVRVERHGLRLRAGLGAGEVLLACVGGLRSRWEFLVAGEPMLQVASAEHEAEPGQAVASAQAWSFLNGRARGESRGQGVLLLEVQAQATPPPPPPDLAPALLRPFVPGAALLRLEGRHFEWLSELRALSIIFGNVSGLDYSRADALEVLQSATLVIQEALYAYQGSLNQLLMDDKGTVFVAAFGLPPVAHSDDPRRALLAALRIRDGMAPLGLRCSLGLSQGRVFCGIRGSPRRREYCLIGDRVNLAARLMQAAEKGGLGEIRCDGEIARLARAAIELESLPALKVKGKEHPIQVFRPLGAAAPLARQQAPLVGRERELVWLLERRGPRRLNGEAGIGKSRLVEEFLARRKAVVVAGDPLLSAEPYGALRPLLEEHGEWLSDHDFGPLAAELLGQTRLDNRHTRGLSGAAHQHALRQMLLDLIKDFCLVCEDAHWLDASSRELLGEAAQRGQDVVVVTRSGAPDWPDMDTLDLQPLSVQAVRAIVAEVLGTAEVPAELLAWVEEKGEGNPLFAQELTRAWEGDRPSEGSSLGTLRGFLTSRLDQLDPAPLLALKVASVVGRTFQVATLQEIFPLLEERGLVPEYLATTAEKGLTACQNRHIYGFRHALIQDVTYELLLYSQKRELHEAAARWLEPDAPPLVLAHHWEQSSRPERALPYLQEAGQKALAMGAYPEAESILRRGLALIEPNQSAPLRRLLAEACYAQGNLTECRELLCQALGLWGYRVPQHPRDLWREPYHWMYLALQAPLLVPGIVGQWLVAGMDWLSTWSFEIRDRQVLARPSAPDPAVMERALAWERLSMLHAYSGDLDLSFQAGSLMTELAEAQGPSPSLARTYAMGAAGCVTLLCMPRLAAYYRDQTLKLQSQFPEPELAARVDYCLSVLHVHQGQWEEAERLLRSALELSELTFELRQASEVRLLLADALLSQGRLGEAEEQLTSVLAKPRLDAQEQSWTLSYLGLLQTLRGHLAEGWDHLLQAQRHQPPRDDIARVFGVGARALNRFLRGDSPEAPLSGQVPSLHWCRMGIFWSAWTDRRGESLALRLLEQGARHHPLCVPGSQLCQGLRRHSRPLLENALAQARRLRMPLETGLALLELGRREEATELWTRHGYNGLQKFTS